MRLLSILFLFTLSLQLDAQLQAGFDSDEYLELLKVSQQQADTFLTNINLPFPDNAERIYRSERYGLENAWEFWLRNDGVGIISIHGTKPMLNSWLENFYTGMVPAEGEWQLNDKLNFKYKLADDPQATIHAGWLTALGFMGPEILKWINTYYQKGSKDFIIMGHSQGGAIAFLLRSWLHYLPEGEVPPGVRFKTYCSAAPKPGNLYYAYDYSYINPEGWEFRVVHSEDWVPETPFSIQTASDINERNPFIHAKEGFKNLSPVKRIFIKSMYNGMNDAADKARDKFIKSLAYRMYKVINEKLPQLREPVYAESMAYMTAGTPIILRPDPKYQEYLDSEKDMEFIHHTMAAYARCIKAKPSY